MILQTKKIELLFLILMLEIFLAITLLFLTARNIEISSYLLFGLVVLLMVISFNTNLSVSFLLSLCTVFCYGSYLLYRIILGDQGVTVLKENYLWLLIFPLAVLTSGKMGEELQELKKEQNRLEEEFHQINYVDPVTSLSTKNRFYLDLTEEIAKVRRHQQPLAVMLIEIQYFSELKSFYKEVEVDSILEGLADKVNQTMRTEDKKYRLAEDFLAVILPFTDLKGAGLVKKRLKIGLEEVSINNKGTSKTLNFNFRIAVKQYDIQENHSPFQFKNLLEKELEYDV